MAPPDPIVVQCESLTGAASDLWDAAGETAHVRDGFSSSLSGVAGACGDPAAGGPFSDLVSSWSLGLSGLFDALTSYERNTETAAVLYEHADRSAMPSTPPPPQKAPSGPVGPMA